GGVIMALCKCGCGIEIIGRKRAYCTKKCYKEANARRNREKYQQERFDQGLTVRYGVGGRPRGEVKGVNPGEVDCLGFCNKKFMSPDYVNIHICPPCTRIVESIW
ncbi:MAG TPA: hypothetical protein ACFYD4_08360, partial [Candidatus Wunengus sp. YC61]|uniref:hypothetical protein n=1 Tax=Candidatus Wunengus sp. YC61 TaxID=3367698 RepID=UPI0040250D16